MDRTGEYTALLENREQLYRLLGRLYKVETDQALLDSMMAMSFPPECGESELDAGYRMLETYLRKPGLDPLTDLAVDYAKVFLGAGITKNGSAAYPYESVYTSPARLIMQDARDQVLAAYRTKGLDKVKTLDVPEDHLGLELEFMGCLCRETQQALAQGDWPTVSASLQEQREFLAKHLLNWVPTFCVDVTKYAETDFYQAVSRMTNGYLRLDRDLLESLIAEPREATA
jgi:putative dimethyl sulfoxide reductase chaperone